MSLESEAKTSSTFAGKLTSATVILAFAVLFGIPTVPIVTNVVAPSAVCPEIA